MVNFNPFVLPFFLGLIFVVIYILWCWYSWVQQLPADDRKKLGASTRNPIVLMKSAGEVFMEGLIHRKMWKQNPLLGYMHMSFALGWFLLIIFGNMESRLYSGTHLNAPYYPIFLKFFIHDRLVIFFETLPVPRFFRFVMDLLLLFVLSGLLLAILKRKKSRWFGMAKTTRYKNIDRIALFSLWLIFPMRLLAESYTAGYYHSGGGFFTQPLGDLLERINPISSEFTLYLMWWGYSTILGVFFFTLPFSRYMHIPSEIFLIHLRQCGIGPDNEQPGFQNTEVHSCSRCGVCIDVCQMNGAGIHDAQAVYFIRNMRDHMENPRVTNQCLVCGRCQEVCPVGIETDAMRLSQRHRLHGTQSADYNFSYNNTPHTAEVAYFSGCMSHLTPGVVRAMKGIFAEAGVNYVHLDSEKSICCGRPIMLAGKENQAKTIIEMNTNLIRQSGAKVLVTSCPICYRVFANDYQLPVRVIHHATFILDLVKQGRIPIQTPHRKIVYHDPCDLGRGMNIFDPPRDLISKLGELVSVDQERALSLCCGGSLGLLEATQEQRNQMTREALEVLMKGDPDVIATGCPLCKKTFAKLAPVPVSDIAELVFNAFPKTISYSSYAHSHQGESCEA